MVAPSIEQSIRERPGPNLKRESIIKFPKDLIRSIDILTLDPIEGIDRKIALIEDINGRKASVYVYSDIPPSRERAKDLFESSKVYTHIGEIGISYKTPLLDLADIKARSQVKKMAVANEKTGVRSDESLLVGGMTALIVPDPENKQSIKDSNLQKAVGFLFSSEGPFKNFRVISHMGKRQTANLIEGGAELLLNWEDFNILAEEAIPFIQRFATTYKTNIRQFLVSIAAYLKKDLSIPEGLDSSRGIDPKEVFLRKKSKIYLTKLLND